MIGRQYDSLIVREEFHMLKDKIVKELCYAIIKECQTDEKFKTRIVELSGQKHDAFELLDKIGYNKKYSGQKNHLSGQYIRFVKDETDDPNNVLINLVIPPESRFEYKVGKIKNDKNRIPKIKTDDFNFKNFNSVTGEILKTIILNTLQDGSVKKALLDNPYEIIKKNVDEMQLKIPDGINFKITVDDEDVYTIVVRSMNNKSLYFGTDNY